VHKITLIPWASYLDFLDSSNSPDYLTVHKITHTMRLPTLITLIPLIPQVTFLDYSDSSNSPDYLSVDKITHTMRLPTLITLIPQTPRITLLCTRLPTL
jgi:hypothetical protein